MIDKSVARKLYEESETAKTKKDYFYIFLENEIRTASEMGLEELSYEVCFKEKLLKLISI